MPLAPLHSEKELFRQLAKGKEPAFRAIFELYRERLQYLALKMLKVPAVAEEVVQDVFMAVWINQVKFSAIDDPEAYVFTIAYNRIYTQLRKTARENQLLEELLYFLQQDHFSADSILQAKESREIIEAAIESMPRQRKLIFKLSRENGMTHEQIAEHLNISRNTVRNHMTEALRDLRNYLSHTTLAILVMMANHS